MDIMLSLVFYSAISSSVINPVAFSDAMTNEAMYWLAYDAPEAHRLVVENVHSIRPASDFLLPDKPLLVAANTRGYEVVYRGRENFTVPQWTSLLVHEAEHIRLYQTEGRDDTESEAVEAEMSLWGSLDLSAGWKTSRVERLLNSLRLE